MMRVSTRPYEMMIYLD